MHITRLRLAAPLLLALLSGSAAASEHAALSRLIEAQRYRQAAPLMRPLLAKAQPDASERGLIYDWLFAVDDLAAVQRRSHGRTDAEALLAQGRLALARKDFDAAAGFYTAALTQAGTAGQRALALRGQGLLAFEQRDYEGALRKHQQAREQAATPDVLVSLADALIRLGRTNEAVEAIEQAIRLNPAHEAANYQLGNGYTRVNYTELTRRCGPAFEHAAGASRQASDAFEQGRLDASRQAAQTALAACPGYGRAHAVLAKVAEAERLAVDVHRAADERRFAATPMPVVPQIERYVLNWASLSQRHRKRVALSIEPWKAYVPILVAGGATHYIKPLYMRLSETPGASSLRDARIEYDSRLWDDVRGMGGHQTVTGIEDVERSIFGRYNTVLHELTHQVHGVLSTAQQREIQELYRRAKERDAQTGRAFVSRYAGGSIWEYFAEGANSQASPRRDAFDDREIGRERLAAIDPDLQALVLRYFAQTDVQASLPLALVNGAMRQFESGELAPGQALLAQALQLAPADEQVLSANLYGLSLAGPSPALGELAERALSLHPDQGALRVSATAALWQTGQPLAPLLERLQAGRETLRADDRFAVDMALGGHALQQGAVAAALAAFERALAYQGDSPEALWGKAAALALDQQWDAAFAVYGQVLKLRTGLVALRLDLARDLMLAGRREAARQQLQELHTLAPREPQLLALQAWATLAEGSPQDALTQADEALALGPWCDTALIVRAAALRRLGRAAEAAALQAELQERVAGGVQPPRPIFRKDSSSWEMVPRGTAAQQRLAAAVNAIGAGS